MSGIIKLILYQTDFCQLCEEAELIVYQTLEFKNVKIVLVDISSDEVLLNKYATLIPVVVIDGNPDCELNWPFSSQNILNLLSYFEKQPAMTEAKGINIMSYDYDLFVIGAGSGGVRAARMAAGLGVKVAVAEELYLGGTCVNVGCIPKKLFFYGASFDDNFKQASSFGWEFESTPKFDWSILRDNKSTEIKRLNQIYYNLLTNSGVSIIDGQAKLLNGNQVTVAGKTYSAKRILIATGSWPFIPKFVGSEYVISSNEVFSLDVFPKKVIIVGGGYIALELASIFNGLGAHTELLYRRDLFLRGFDKDIREFVCDQMQQGGIKLNFNTEINSVKKLRNNQLEASLNNNNKTITADVIVYATGRVPKTFDIGLQELGVQFDNSGAIKVNEFFQTNVPSVYALGDVIGGVQLTPVALAEGMALVRHLYQNDQTALNYGNIPSAVFCQPNIATIGLTEEQAIEKYSDDLDIYQSSFKPLKYTLTNSYKKCFIKMLVHKKTDKIIGVHMVGNEVGEIMQGIAVAMNAGATKTIFDQTIGIHPTTAEELVTLREPNK